MIRRIAVLTGDTNIPGMNAAIRAVTQTARYHEWEVFGVCEGFTGLVTGDFIRLTSRTVEGIISRAGTLLGGTEGKYFAAKPRLHRALDRLIGAEIDALIVIGSNEAQANAQTLSQMGFPVNGVAASVENDLAGFEIALGVDTAMNVALDYIDHLKLARIEESGAFIVEVAGRRCGCLALMAGIAGGADAVVIPEVETSPEQIASVIRNAYDAGRSHPVIVVSEGAVYNADRLRRHFAKDRIIGRRLRDTRLSFLQRRTAPHAYDRMLGAHLGTCAVETLAQGKTGVIVGSHQGATRALPFAEVVGKTNDLDAELIQLADIFSISGCKTNSTGIVTMDV